MGKVHIHKCIRRARSLYTEGKRRIYVYIYTISERLFFSTAFLIFRGLVLLPSTGYSPLLQPYSCVKPWYTCSCHHLGESPSSFFVERFALYRTCDLPDDEVF